jgi:hypothetical protein
MENLVHILEHHMHSSSRPEREGRPIDQAFLDIEYLRTNLSFFLLLNSISGDDRGSAVKLSVFKLFVLIMKQRVATEPHDQVYAFRDLFQELGIVITDPDYSPSVEHVFDVFTFQVVDQSKCLLILEHVTPWQNTTKPRLHVLPSWVPDYS